MNITNHTQLLNYLIEKHGLKSYLEIGVQSTAQNFDKIKLPSANKVGVDPCLQLKDNLLPLESDTFFKHQTDTFDLIFIDGLHHADQVERDFNNSLACLNDGGYIVIHDTLPENEIGTFVPRQTRQWWGDVYKWAMCIANYNDIQYETVDIDNGCTVVWKEPGNDFGAGLSIKSVTWGTYLQGRSKFLNIIQPSEIEKYF